MVFLMTDSIAMIMQIGCNFSFVSRFLIFMLYLCMALKGLCEKEKSLSYEIQHGI